MVASIFMLRATVPVVLPPGRSHPQEKEKRKGKPAAAALAVLVPKTGIFEARVMSEPSESHDVLSIAPLLASPSETDPGCPAVAASNHRGRKVECQSWLMDTGCKYDLTTRASVPLPLRDSITDSAEPITLHTANGLTDCTLCVSQQIVGLHETVEP